jgi:hypothetical protein
MRLRLKWPFPWFLLLFGAIGSIVFFRSIHQNHTKEKNPSEIVQGYNVTTFPPLTLWSSDFHIAPIADIKHLLRDFNVKVIDKSLSSHCHLSNTCATDLKVINRHNGIALSPCPNQLRKEFYDFYRQNDEFMSADMVLCTHAISMCELFMPFNKPLILIASTRYEIGRHDEKSWLRWNTNLELISAKWYNSIAANNKYDQVLQLLAPLSPIIGY